MDQPALLSPLDDGVDHGPAVPHDEDPLGAGEDPGEILGVLQGQRVLGSSVSHSGSDLVTVTDIDR